MDGAGGIARTGIEVVAVFQTDRTDNGFPAETGPGGEECFVQRIVVQIARHADRIGEDNQGEGAGESLLELDVAKEVAFSSHESARRVSGRSLALLIAANRILAAGKEPPIEGEILLAGAKGENDAVAQSKVHPCAIVEWKMARTGGFEALIIGVAAEIS